MVSRGRQTAELNKHRGLQDFQMIAKHNTALAVFASEAHAEAACAALREKAHLVWRIPKVMAAGLACSPSTGSAPSFWRLAMPFLNNSVCSSSMF